jgi:phosphatidylglycerophosphate synthase
MKRIADMMTASRFVFGVLIAWIGATQHDQVGLSLVVWLTLAAWTTDSLDGPLARRSRFTQQTWLGHHDLEADLAITLALAITLVSRSLIWPVLVAVGLLIFWILWRLFIAQERPSLREFGIWPDHAEETPDSAPVELMMAVIDAGFLYLVWMGDPVLFRVVVIWIAASALLNPRRSWQRIRGFLVASRRLVPDKTPSQSNAEK